MPPRKHVFGYKIYHQMKYKLPVAKTELQNRVGVSRGRAGGPGLLLIFNSLIRPLELKHIVCLSLIVAL